MTKIEGTKPSYKYSVWKGRLTKRNMLQDSPPYVLFCPGRNQIPSSLAGSYRARPPMQVEVICSVQTTPLGRSRNPRQQGWTCLRGIQTPPHMTIHAAVLALLLPPPIPPSPPSSSACAACAARARRLRRRPPAPMVPASSLACM